MGPATRAQLDVGDDLEAALGASSLDVDPARSL
jgi:hypothetical protein